MYHAQEIRNIAAARISGIVIGKVVCHTAAGPLINMPLQQSESRLARLATGDTLLIGDEVALSFENGDPTKPIILGKILRPAEPPIPEVEIDEITESLDLSAERAVTIRCGKASITLTREGKIILRGTYISSRSSGANRIKGGSVHLN